MVLSDRFASKTPASLLKRTVLYVCGFGLGALLIVGGLSFALVSIAEGLLPKPPSHAAGAKKTKGKGPVKIIGGKPTGGGRARALPRPASKPAASRKPGQTL